MFGLSARDTFAYCKQVKQTENRLFSSQFCDLLAQDVVQIPAGGRHSAISSGATQRHQLVRRVRLVHVSPVRVVEHFTGFLPGN